MKIISVSSSAVVHLALIVFLQGCTMEHDELPSIVYSSSNALLQDGDTRLVSFATYNLKGLRDPKGLARTLAALDFVDIWAFQEVNKSIEEQSDMIAFHECDPPDQLLNLLPPAKWNAFYVPMNRVRMGKEWEGMAIFSNSRIVERGIWALRATGTRQQGALYSVVSIDDENRVLIINTSHEIGMLSYTPLDRQQQVADLKTNIRDGPYADVPVALLGDFNTVGYHPLMPWRRNGRDEVSELKNSLREIELCSLPESAKPCDTFRSYIYSAPLDHIFIRDLQCIQWGVTNGYVGSDHRPLWTIVQVRKMYAQSGKGE